MPIQLVYAKLHYPCCMPLDHRGLDFFTLSHGPSPVAGGNQRFTALNVISLAMLLLWRFQSVNSVA